MDWKGLRITIKLTIHKQQVKLPRVFSIATLVIKVLKEPEHDPKKMKNIKDKDFIMVNGDGSGAEAGVNGLLCSYVPNGLPAQKIRDVPAVSLLGLVR
ncbi:60S ribosomal protein L12-1 [Striga hermonthica]|uniref:60S ribosomal protein L12-1 n=1 Tax=Striga hermonthica TaxID=68872 RepID=A0A9N7NFL1_STRHE|nr:60S ribosomal protein L12-1 [Striga hermonthica]